MLHAWIRCGSCVASPRPWNGCSRRRTSRRSRPPGRQWTCSSSAGKRWPTPAGAAAGEAARDYPGSSVELVALFARIRGDQLLRRFLAPKILESLYVLGDPAALPLLEELLVAGHTDPDPDRCEVTRALVAVRKLTGRVAPSAKFPDPADSAVARSLDEAERRFEAERDQLLPVT